MPSSSMALYGYYYLLSGNTYCNTFLAALNSGSNYSLLCQDHCLMG